MSVENTRTSRVDQTHLEMMIGRVLLGRVRVHRFQVALEDEGLVLKGCTSTYYAKQLVQHAVMEVSRLPILANEIEVQ